LHRHNVNFIRDFAISTLLLASLGISLSSLAENDTPPLALKHGSLGLEQLSIVENGKVIGGFKYDLLEEITKRINWTVDHSYCPFQRCLRSMADGQLDIMVFIAVNQDRSQYMDFVQIWKIPRKVPFFTLRGREQELTRYEDLKNLRIGVVNGYAYFRRFDNDITLRKSIVLKESQLPKMLMAGRIDTYIGFNQRQDILLSNYPDLRVAPYSHPFSNTALLAISKKSPLAARIRELEVAALSVIKDGTMDELWFKYIGSQEMPYPRHLGPPADTNNPPLATPPADTDH